MTDATVRDAQPADAVELVRLDAVLLDSAPFPRLVRRPGGL